jgi:hypothetical protein
MRVTIIAVAAGATILAWTSLAGASQDVSLRYGETGSPLTAYGHYLESELDVRVTSGGEDGTAAENVVKKESATSLDTRKEFELRSLKDSETGEGARSYYIMNEKVTALRADGPGGKKAEGRIHHSATKMDSLGNPQTPSSLVDFPYASFPFILPEQAVHEGDRWVSPLLIITADGSEIDVQVSYSLTRIANRDGMRIADIEYRLAGELTSTDVTDDAGRLTRIDEMRRKGIEKISLSGTGRVGFDIDKHIPAMHVTDLVLEIAAKNIEPSRMVQQERTVEMHKAEAMLAL